MKKIYTFDEEELGKLRNHLRQINHDVGVINQNSNNLEVVLDYVTCIETDIKKALELIKD
jgi:ferredoxin-fold anticodon binding domain-containing protein